MFCLGKWDYVWLGEFGEVTNYHWEPLQENGMSRWIRVNLIEFEPDRPLVPAIETYGTHCNRNAKVSFWRRKTQLKIISFQK